MWAWGPPVASEDLEAVVRGGREARPTGCSDSRVPAEIIFDQGLGGLFVVRVAGNVAAPTQIGSVEFAADQFGTRLVIVMGHTHPVVADQIAFRFSNVANTEILVDVSYTFGAPED